MRKVKINIEQGFMDAMGHFRVLFGPLMVMGVFSFILQIVMKLWQRHMFENILETGFRLTTQLVQIGLVSVSIFIAILIVTIIKEHMHKVSYTLGQKLLFAFKKTFVFWGGVLLITLCMVPVFVGVGVIGLNSRFFMTVAFILVMIVMAFALLPMVFFMTSAVLEDLGAVKALKNSYRLVGHNYFRMLLLFIGVGTFTVGMTWLGNQLPLYISWVFNAVQTVLSLFLATFYACMYGQALDAPEET